MDINSKALASLGLLGNVYTPDNLKKAYIKDWQKNPTSINYCLEEINKGNATGYAVVTGNDGLIALDFDGNNANRIAIEALPWVMDIATLTWSSGKPNRKGKMFRIPEGRRQEFAHITKRSIKSYANIKELPLESLEVSYKRSKVTLPPSAHPETDGYKWVNFVPIHELTNSQCDSLLELLRKNYEKHESIKQYTLTDKTNREKGIALEALDYINPDLEYEGWIKIGTALKNMSFDFSVWDSWSNKGEKYAKTNTREMERKWQGFNNTSLGIQTILYYADGFDQRRSKVYTLTDKTTISSEVKTKTREVNNSKKSQKKEDKYGTYLYGDALEKGLGARKDYLVSNLIPEGEMILVSALPGTGKSLLGYDLTYSVLTGTEFLGQKCKRGKVWILSTDEGENMTLQRLEERGCNLLDNANDIMLTYTYDITDLKYLEAKIKEFEPDLIIFDSLTTISRSTGISENSAEFGKLVYDLKGFLGKHKISSVLIHHNNKIKEAKGLAQIAGTTRIPAAAYSSWIMSGIEKSPNKSIFMTGRGHPDNTHYLKLNEEEDWAEKGFYTHLGEANFSNEAKGQKPQILALLRKHTEGLESKEIQKYLPEVKSIRSILQRLIGDGDIMTKPSSINKRRKIYYAINLESKDSSATENELMQKNDCDSNCDSNCDSLKSLYNKDYKLTVTKNSNCDSFVTVKNLKEVSQSSFISHDFVTIKNESIDSKGLEEVSQNCHKNSNCDSLIDKCNTNKEQQKEISFTVDFNSIAKELSVLFSNKGLVTKDERLAYVREYFNNNSIENINSISDKQIFSLLEHLKIEE